MATWGNAWLRTNTVGSGPYKVVEWKPNESVLMDLNPNYHGDKPAMERVIVQHIQESATQRLQLERGDVDVARNLSPEDVAGLGGVDGGQSCRRIARPPDVFRSQPEKRNAVRSKGARSAQICDGL